MKSIPVLSVIGELRFHATLLDPSWKICRHGKMRSHHFPSNQMKKTSCQRSSRMLKSSEPTFLRSATLSWEQQRKPKLNASISARLKVPRFCSRSRQISSDKSFTSGHRLHLRHRLSSKLPSQLASRVQLSYRSSWHSTASMILSNFRRI